MTAAQLFLIHPDHLAEIPDLAVNPTVQIVADLDETTLGSCGLCPDRGWYGAEPVPDGLMRVTYQLTKGGYLRFTDTCAEHAEEELAHLLHMRHKGWYPIPSITLHVPADWALQAFTEAGVA